MIGNIKQNIHIKYEILSFDIPGPEDVFGSDASRFSSMDNGQSSMDNDTNSMDNDTNSMDYSTSSMDNEASSMDNSQSSMDCEPSPDAGHRVTDPRQAYTRGNS